jgi:ribosomal protein S18 acetylase RimI-like enzyme
MSNWTVDEPQQADFARWRELYRGYANFYEVAQTDEQAARVWSWLHDPAHEQRGLVVRDGNGEVAGLAHYRPFSRPLRASTGAFLDDLYVDPAHRGNGAVDALLAGLRDIARDEGWDVIRWITADDNYRARSKYDQVASRTPWITYDLTP